MFRVNKLHTEMSSNLMEIKYKWVSERKIKSLGGFFRVIMQSWNIALS